MALIQNLARPSTLAFELKGRMMTLSVMRVLSADIEALCRQLDVNIASAPGLFHNFPVLLDFDALTDDSKCSFDIARLNRALRERSIIPVGVRAAGDVLAGIAAGVGIGTVSTGAIADRERRELDTVTPDTPNDATANVLIRHPIRSGQQVYAERGDLIVLATVSPGAEVLADGNIHIYGSLHGRALAGVRGNTHARIFCHRLDAELISVAGHYRLSDSIPSSYRRPVQIYLDNENVIIENL